MTEPTSSIRHLVRAALVVGISDNLPGVQVEPGDPGDKTQNEAVIFLGSTGPAVVPVSQAGRRQRQDDFTMALIIKAAKPGQTIVQAAERAAEMLAAVTDVLADNATLDNLPGLQSIGDEMQIDEVAPWWTETGAVALINVEIDAKTRWQ